MSKALICDNFLIDCVVIIDRKIECEESLNLGCKPLKCDHFMYVCDYLGGNHVRCGYAVIPLDDLRE